MLRLEKGCSKSGMVAWLPAIAAGGHGRYRVAWAIQGGARQGTLAVEFGRRVIGNSLVGTANQDINIELFVLIWKTIVLIICRIWLVGSYCSVASARSLFVLYPGGYYKG